jgi:hypothetical protein
MFFNNSRPASSQKLQGTLNQEAGMLGGSRSLIANSELVPVSPTGTQNIQKIL